MPGKIRALFAVLVPVLAVGAPAGAVIDLVGTTQATFTWDPPQSGTLATQVDSYAVLIYVDGAFDRAAIVEDNRYTVQAEFGDTVAVRVAGRALLRFGKVSDLSEPVRFLMGSPQPSPTPAPTPPPPPSGLPPQPAARDFDGDGRSDLLIRDDLRGIFGIWQMGPNGPVATTPLQVVSGLARIVAAADHDGDGRSDLLWEQGGTLSLGITGSLPGSLSSRADFALAPGWVALLAADHDGDGRADVLLRNDALKRLEVWSMNGSALLGATAINHGLDSDWVVAASGDWDGDGQWDLVWQRGSRVELWRLDGLALASRVRLQTPGSGWSVEFAADLDGDGRSDLVLVGPNGELDAWLVRAGLSVTVTALAATLAPGQQPLQSGDYRAEGRAGIAVENLGAGGVEGWWVNGAAVDREVLVSSVGNWSVVPLGPGN